MQEEWKVFEKNRQTIWMVSNFGRIMKNSKIVDPGNCLAWGRYLKAKSNLPLHIVVAKYFVPNPDSLPFVNHKDGNRMNNHYTNLEWVTAQENVIHSYENDLQIKKTTNQERNDLLKELLNNIDPKLLAKKYNMSLRNVYYYKKKSRLN